MAQMVDERFLVSLAGELASTTSGIDFVYRALERLAERYELGDAIVVVDEAPIGRQLFRLGRRPVQGFGISEVVQHALNGLYCEPAGIDGAVADAVTNLCTVALRLDLLRHDASRDSLTGLFNRRTFDAMFEQFAARSARYGWPFALGLLDLDGFKAVNDRMGHDGGDVVLRTIGSELRSTLRAGDVAARVGGDEFAVLITNGTPELIESVVERLVAAVNSDLTEMRVGFSAGVAVAPADGTDAGALYRIADHRLYVSKRG